jgi:hypothetical protein
MVIYLVVLVLLLYWSYVEESVALGVFAYETDAGENPIYHQSYSSSGPY